MPFVQRVVEPKYLSRRSLHGEGGQPLVTDYELEAVTNNTLSSALRQLASLVLIANDIFEDLSKQLQDVCERSKRLRTRIAVVEEKVVAFDPKKVTVPESDLTTFSLRTKNFSSCKENTATKNLFCATTRPDCVRRLYESAAKTPVHVMRQLDRYRRDGRRSSRYFLCTPVLGGERRSVAKIKHKPGIDIETRMPAVVNELRRWTSEEAIGDITVTPDCASRIASSTIDAETVEIGVEDDTVDAGTDHRLPSPEEQIQTVALRFPAEVVAVDVSGRAFDRMTSFRRSLMHVQVDADGTVRRRHKKPRGRRRNTIAGTDQRELEQAVTGESPNSELPDLSADAISVVRSASSDLLRSKDDSPSEGKKSHFNTLKQWGKVKLKLIRSVSGESSKTSTLSPDEANIYETVGAKGKKGDLKHDKKSSKAAGTNIPISTSSGAMNMAVKLREGSVRRRALVNGKEDPLHSSSGNWSASSESGRASVGSENTVTTHQPKSTTTLSSAATSSNSLHHQPPSSTVSSRRKFLNTSASSSISEGTLTPDIMSDLMSPFPDDGETSSIYSCDTEGYYTSFHLDSGLKTLKEEETSSPQTPLHSTTALSTSPGRSNTTLTAENEYELFGKGSTSTTTSSAGTVCTTLLVGENNLSVATAPAVPERKSSLEGKDGKNSQMVIAMIHKQTEGPSESPDSGHNTSSSPVDSTNSPPGTLTGRSSEYEFSESDLEGVDRIERIRVKTTINSSRIPSMCVITPPQSDDETSQYVPSYYSRKYNTLTLHDRGSKQFNVESYLQGEDNYSADNPQSRYNSLPRSFEKQLSTDSDRSSEPEPTKVRSRSACRSVTSSGYGSVKQFERSASLKARVSGPSPSPTRKAITSENAQKSNNQQNKVVPTLKSSFQPLNNMIGKVKGVLSHAGSGRKNSKSSAGEDSDNSPTESKVPSQVDAGDYVTIADVRNNTRNTAQNSNTYANTIPHSTAADKLEYVSLNELPTSVRPSSPSGNPLTAPFDSSLERKRRQGARVTLDSEGKVVYSSDSLKRNKGAHTTFEPGPCVRDLSTTPVASPIPSHRIPKSNIRPVIVSNQQGRTSPSVAGGTKSPVNQRNRSTSPRQRVSPTSPTSPQLGKVIIRAGSKTTPMTRVASPPLAVASRPMSPKPSVASGRGAYVHMQSSLPPGGRSANPPASSPNEHDEDRTSQGYASPRRAPPKYVSPPPAHPSHWPSSPQSSIGLKQQYPQSYWTLPARKPQNFPGVSAGQETVAVDTQRNGRFNTIATSGRSPNYAQNYPPYNDVRNYYGNALSPPNGACHSSQLRTPYPPGQSAARSQLGSAGYSQYPPSASITTTQRNDSNRTPTRQESRNIFFSSTPTKKEKTELLYQNDSTMMNLGKTFSPIEKSSRQRELERMAADSKQQQNRLNSHSRSATPCLLSPPKTSMTSEEIFAAIHKSKKRMNIKTDSDSFSRSNSPSLSSVTSISPGSSESSVNCIGRCITPVKNAPEVGSFQGDNSPGSRHSWSPNSGEYYDFYSRFEHRSPSPVISPGSRQSWACDRLGPRQQTSRNDFKRLLLQQGTKLNPNTLTGSSSSRISAVEQLRLTRHQKLGTVTSNGMISNSYTPRSPVDKKIVSSKLLQSPRSNTGWRFASPRSDVLSSTILEDCAEEEKASCSPQHSPTVKPAHQTQQMTLSNSSVRRPLNLSFNSNAKQESNTEPQIYQDKTNTSHTITRDSSPRTITKCLSNNLSSMKFLTSECASHNNPSLSNGSLHSRELLSPSNVKENVNTNLQRTGDNTSRGSESSLKQSLNRLILHSPSPRINMLLAKQRNSQYASHGTTARSILGALTSAKSPPKATLETAL